MFVWRKMFQALHHNTIHCMNVIIPLKTVCHCIHRHSRDEAIHSSIAINAYNDSEEHFPLFYYRYNEVQWFKGLVIITKTI